MVKHIIIWNLKEEFNTPEIKNGIVKGLSKGIRFILNM